MIPRFLMPGEGKTGDIIADLPILASELQHESRKKDIVQVRALLAAGWSFELPASEDPEPMSWYWRRPPRRKGSKGRFYWSTNQAYIAMMREKGGAA